MRRRLRSAHMAKVYTSSTTHPKGSEILPSGVAGRALWRADELPDRLPDLDKALLEPDLETVLDELEPDSRDPDLAAWWWWGWIMPPGPRPTPPGPIIAPAAIKDCWFGGWCRGWWWWWWWCTCLWGWFPALADLGKVAIEVETTLVPFGIVPAAILEGCPCNDRWTSVWWPPPPPPPLEAKDLLEASEVPPDDTWGTFWWW